MQQSLQKDQKSATIVAQISLQSSMIIGYTNYYSPHNRHMPVHWSTIHYNTHLYICHVLVRDNFYCNSSANCPSGCPLDNNSLTEHKNMFRESIN